MYSRFALPSVLLFAVILFIGALTAPATVTAPGNSHADLDLNNPGELEGKSRQQRREEYFRRREMRREQQRGYTLGALGIVVGVVLALGVYKFVSDARRASNATATRTRQPWDLE